ncbi:Phospholipase D [bacterium HR19]|nr:Phospholipase D [bacterium HR19]
MFFVLLFFISARVEVFFSATDGCEDKVINAINSAQRELKIAVYSFTSREISQAVLDAIKRGVSVRIVVDGEQAKDRFSKAGYLASQGVNIKVVDYTPRRKKFLVPKMHHKFMVVDNKFVMTGSFNFTASAEELNDENCVFIYDDENAVKKFSNEFERLWRISTTY